MSREQLEKLLDQQQVATKLSHEIAAYEDRDFREASFHLNEAANALLHVFVKKTKEAGR